MIDFVLGWAAGYGASAGLSYIPNKWLRIALMWMVWFLLFLVCVAISQILLSSAGMRPSGSGANLLATGMSIGFISRWMAGRKKPEYESAMEPELESAMDLGTAERDTLR